MVVVEIDDKTSLEYAILENVQRADLNPIEEAQGYSRLMAEFSYTQENLVEDHRQEPQPHRQHDAPRPICPSPCSKLLVNRQITAGHGRALLSVNDPVRWRKRIVDQGMSVRQVEEIAQADQAMPRNARNEVGRTSPQKDPDTRALERALQDVLGLNVEHRPQGEGRRIADLATRPWSNSTVCADG